MNILLVVPRYTSSTINLKKNYQYPFPIGLGYICAVIKKAGYNVDVINLNHHKEKIEYLIFNALNKKKYDVLATGNMASGFQIIEKIINASKNHSSKPIVILGGPMIISEPYLMIKNLDFDYGVIGEGEVTIVDLLNTLKENKDVRNVPGIIYRDKNNKIIITEKREEIQDLDSLPFPDYEALGYEEYLEHMTSNDALYNYFDYPRTYMILGTRGCPFNCTFCYHTLGGNKYRSRSVKNLISEIKFAIKKYKINSFILVDDMFSYNKEKFKKFTIEIKKLIDGLEYEFKWACSAAVTSVNKEILQSLKDSGCYYIGFGFESFSKDVLKSMKKPITPQLIDRAIKDSLELNMPIVGNFIFGDVAETFETINTTLNYWKKHCEGQVQLHFINPFPSSEIYKTCLRKGIIKDKLKFIKYEMHHTNLYNMTDNMSDKDYKKAIKMILRAKYKYSKYVTPISIKQEKEEHYSISVQCPFCKQKIDYKNCYIPNKNYYTIYTACRNKNCHRRFFMVSPLYKFTMKYYIELDFLRKNYLKFRDIFLKSKM